MKYYSMKKVGNDLDVCIFGEITSMPYTDGDVSAKSIYDQIKDADVERINVRINSYGGEVAEGLAIYNALRSHKAKVVTYCDGFACSIASVIFMAGDERIMSDSSLLMIHNAWSWGVGNADQLRKQADDLEKITQASVTAYKEHSTLSEEEIKKLMDEETWILPEEAIEYGFATGIEKAEGGKKAAQNAQNALCGIVRVYKASVKEEDGEDDKDGKDDATGDDKPDTDDKDEKPDTETDDTDTNTDDETPDGDDTTPDDEDKDPEETDDKNEEKKAAEKLSGFFNAILKM